MRNITNRSNYKSLKSGPSLVALACLMYVSLSPCGILSYSAIRYRNIPQGDEYTKEPLAVCHAATLFIFKFSLTNKLFGIK